MTSKTSCRQKYYLCAQNEAARLLNIDERIFCRWRMRYEEEGVAGLAGRFNINLAR